MSLQYCFFVFMIDFKNNANIFTSKRSKDEFTYLRADFYCLEILLWFLTKSNFNISLKNKQDSESKGRISLKKLKLMCSGFHTAHFYWCLDCITTPFYQPSVNIF